eukprot:GAFH01002395.1.p1 GENE.GAFH01002395.1~~GAFH01002395.1.p1  ORF type:complete len:337 (+),score=113.49 GAFH01002395.1:82-1011(+)
MYAARDKTEISFQVNDVLNISQIGEDGWYTGECRGQFGLFPGNYVKIEETPATAAPPAASGGNDLIIKSLEDEMAKLRARLEEETRQRLEVEQKNTNLESRLQSVNEQLAAISKAKDDAEAQLHSLQQRLQAVRQHEHDQVQQQQQQLTEAQAEIATLRTTVEEANRAKGLLQTEVEEFRALLSSQVQGAHESATANPSLETLQAEASMLRAAREADERVRGETVAQLGQLQVALKEAAAKAAAVDAMRRQVAKYRKLNTTLEQSLGEATKRVAALGDEAQHSAAYAKGLEEEAAKAWKQMQELQKHAA